MPNPDHRQNGEFRAGNTARQKGPDPADHHLHVRVPGQTKGRWVGAARARGMKLTDWVIETLDREADNRDAQ